MSSGECWRPRPEPRARAHLSSEVTHLLRYAPVKTHTRTPSREHQTHPSQRQSKKHNQTWPVLKATVPSTRGGEGDVTSERTVWLLLEGTLLQRKAPGRSDAVRT